MYLIKVFHCQNFLYGPGGRNRTASGDFGDRNVTVTPHRKYYFSYFCKKSGSTLLNQGVTF